MKSAIQDIVLSTFRIFLFFGFAVIKLLYHLYLILYPYIPSFQIYTPKLFEYDKTGDNIDIEQGFHLSRMDTKDINISIVTKDKDLKQTAKSKPQVLIIGGGFGGTLIAQLLISTSEFEVILVDDKDYFEYTPSLTKLVQNPHHHRMITMDHKSFLRGSRHIEGLVEKINLEKGFHVYIKNGETVSVDKDFDYLVFCTGASYKFRNFIPTEIETTSSYESKSSTLIPIEKGTSILNYTSIDMIKSYSHIIVIGGGATGVELAAELVEKFSSPDSPELILVHSSQNLLNTFCTKASDIAFNFFKDKRIKVITGERAAFLTNGSVTSSLARNECDGIIIKDKAYSNALGFLCTGPSPNLSFLNKDWPLDEYGYIKVNKFLQISNNWNGISDFPNIFACGDIISVPGDSQKLAQITEIQANIIAQNICSLKDRKSLFQYYPSPKIVVVSLGRHNGIVCYNNFAFRGFFTVLLKEVIEWKTMIRYWSWSRWWNPFYKKAERRYETIKTSIQQKKMSVQPLRIVEE